MSFSPSQALQQVIKDLDIAFKNFFRGMGYPKFKKKHKHNGFRLPQGICLKKQLSAKCGQVKLPKLGLVCFTKTKDVEGRIRYVTISTKCGRWYISFNCEIETDIELRKEGGVIGIDRGIACFAACSNGESIEALSPFKKSSKKLAKLQRKQSAKKKYSSNWKKLKRKIENIYCHIANSRKDFIHKKTSELSNSHRLIAMEILRVRNMTQSAKGTMDNPGKNVKAKAGLNRSILDQGWTMFARILEYKMLWSGGEVGYVDAKYTSQKCSNCAYIAKENRQSQASFLCTKCGYSANADFNASKNILDRYLRTEGHSGIACGVETLVDTVKQELVMRKPISV